MKTGLLVFIMGVSGAGKNTVLHLLSKNNPEFREIISYKTRPLRPGEIDGVDFHSMTRQSFEHAIETGDFLEYAKLYGGEDYYGTKRLDIANGLSQGYILIKEIDMQGIEQIAHNDHPLYAKSLRIFLDLPEEVMIKRITTRAPIAEEELQRRIHTAVEERRLAKQYATTIISAAGTIDEVYHKVYEYIKTFL